MKKVKSQMADYTHSGPILTKIYKSISCSIMYVFKSIIQGPPMQWMSNIGLSHILYELVNKILLFINRGKKYTENRGKTPTH